MFKLRIIAAIVIYAISPTIFAQHVLPSFSATWFLNSALLFLDSCGQAHYSHDVEAKGDAMAAAAKFLANPPPHTDCTWQNHKLVATYNDMPGDFVGTVIDWNTLLASHSPQLIQKWQRDCINNQGKTIDSISIVMQPSYQCTNSRFSLADEDDFRIGCSTHPGVCVADLVGRDMDSQQFKSLGHVGLTEGEVMPAIPDMVVEALNEPIIIQDNTLDNFTHRTIYWGAKYGLKNLPTQSLTDAESTQIMADTSMQQTCDYVGFTYFWNWYPCHYDQAQGKKIALFRCDSFVYNSYLEGIGVKILDYGIGMGPKDIFNAFLQPRIEHYANDSGTKNIDLPFEIGYQFGIERIMLEDAIESIFVNKIFDIKNADIATYAFVAKSSNISRDEKLSFIWKLALQYHNDELRFSYLIDCLDYLNPIELTNDILNEFDQQQNVQNKLKLMNILVDMTANDAVNLYGQLNIASLSATNIATIKHFFSNLLLHEKNLTLLEKAIFSYPHIFMPAQAKIDIDDVFQRKDIDTKTLQNNLFQNKAYFTHQLEMIFSSSEMQKTYLPALLKDIENLSVSAKSNFCNSLYFIFADADFNPPKIGFDSSKINDSVRPILLRYLETQRQEPFKADHVPIFNANSQEKMRYNWLSSYMAVKAHSIDEKNQLITNYIKNINNLSEKSAMIFYATKGVLQQFKDEELISLENLLQTSLNSANQSLVKRTAEQEQQADISRLYLQMGLSKILHLTAIMPNPRKTSK